MNRPLSTYCRPNSTSSTLSESHFSGGKRRSSFTDEENASGFFNSKAQRERFAEYHDFPISHSSKQDAESGYHYFGARYMDHDLMTMWLSVDPMSDKYPSLSPYNYCHWSPLNLVDRTGMYDDGWQLELTTGVWTKTDSRGAGFQNFYTFTDNGKIIGTATGLGCDPTKKTENSELTASLFSFSCESFSMQYMSVGFNVTIDKITYSGNVSASRTAAWWDMGNWSDGFKLTTDVISGGLLFSSNAFNPEIGGGGGLKPEDPGFNRMSNISKGLTITSAVVSMAVGYTNFRTGFSNGDYGQMTRGGVEFLSGLTGAASFAAPPGPWKLGLSVTSTVLSTADLIFGGMIDERW